MANKTIYVKDEIMWERAKELASTKEGGLSGLISEALASFMEQKDLENEGFSSRAIQLAGENNQLLRFFGRHLNATPVDRIDVTPPREAMLDVYQTKAGKFVVVLTDTERGKPYDYELHSSLDQIREGMAWDLIPPDFQERFLEDTRDYIHRDTTIWID